MPASLTLGDEYDERLLKALSAVLREPETRILSDHQSHGGSQDLREVEVERSGKRLKIEIETFMGVSIMGEADALEEFVRTLNANGANVSQGS